MRQQRRSQHESLYSLVCNSERQAVRRGIYNLVLMKKKVTKPTPLPLQVTLSVDIGGTGIKMMALDNAGKPLTERIRALTPENPTPERVLKLLEEMRAQLPDFDRVSVGFPGVVKNGVTIAAHNLSPKWAEFPLQETLHELWKKPVRVANDASVQGYGAIFGKGVELCLTLGTGLGSSLFTGGHLCPGLELAHHPWRKGKTYEDFIGLRGLEKYGKKKWNKLVQEAIAQTSQLFNWDYLHLGGGNAKRIDFELAKNIRIVDNDEGLLGGVALWRNEPAI
jgi:polyphosphate glucokinase